MTVLWKVFIKNWEKIRANQEQYSLKIKKILGTADLGSNFTCCYKNSTSVFAKNCP